MCLCKVIFTTAFWEPDDFSQKKINAALITFGTLQFHVLAIILRSIGKLHLRSIPQAWRWSFLTEQPFSFRSNCRFPLLPSQTGQNLTYEIILALLKQAISGFLRGLLFVSAHKKGFLALLPFPQYWDKQYSQPLKIFGARNCTHTYALCNYG